MRDCWATPEGARHALLAHLDNLGWSGKTNRELHYPPTELRPAIWQRGDEYTFTVSDEAYRAAQRQDSMTLVKRVRV